MIQIIRAESQVEFGFVVKDAFEAEKDQAERCGQCNLCRSSDRRVEAIGTKGSYNIGSSNPYPISYWPAVTIIGELEKRALYSQW